MSQKLIGQVLLDQYRIDSFIATGGMGTVFRVWDLKRNVPLALKMLHTDLQDDPSIFKRFRREANALKRLTHPNIVPFYGIHHTDDYVFLLQKFVDGPTLKQVIKQLNYQPMPTMEALTYLKALSASLGYAHNNGVVHCDVKPGNVMIDSGGSIYLTDFGIARHAESTTTTYGAAGTAAYMAPEQIYSESVAPSADIYALGVILYEMMVGQRPFRGNEAGTESGGATSAERIRYAHLNLSPPYPRTMNPAVSDELSAVIMKALEKEPENRYQTTQELFSSACWALGVDPLQVPDTINLKQIEESRGALPVPIPVIAATGGAEPQGFLQRITSSRLEGRKAYGAIGSIAVMALLMLCIGLTVFGGLGRGSSGVSVSDSDGSSNLGGQGVVFITETPLPGTETPLPTATDIPTATPLPTITPTITSTFTLEEAMQAANVLVYEEAWGSFDSMGRPLDKRIDNVLDTMGLTGRNIVRDRDALGDFLGHLNSGTEWDLIIVSAENRNFVRGELWDAIAENIEDSDTALVAEMWYLDQIHIGRITPLMNKCGIAFQKNWTKDPGINPNSSKALSSYIVYALEPTHPIFHDPNELKRGGLIVPSTNYFMGYDVGDLLEINGGDAKLLAGTHSDIEDQYGVIAECMDGRILWVTMGTHDFKREDVEDLWENYITYALKNHFTVNP